MRSLIGSALQVTASAFEFADLVNTDRSRLRLPDFKERLRQEVASAARATYGIDLRTVGIERLSLPEQTLMATVARMRAERETIAAARTSDGLRIAAEIRSSAKRDARLTQAKAQTDAAEIEASSRQEAAGIYAKAYDGDPQLYLLIRSLDALTDGQRQHEITAANRCGPVQRARRYSVRRRARPGPGRANRGPMRAAA